MTIWILRHFDLLPRLRPSPTSSLRDLGRRRRCRPRIPAPRTAEGLRASRTTCGARAAALRTRSGPDQGLRPVPRDDPASVCTPHGISRSGGKSSGRVHGRARAEVMSRARGTQDVPRSGRAALGVPSRFQPCGASRRGRLLPRRRGHSDMVAS